MLKLHHLEKSRSYRIAWLLEELNLEYEVVEYKRDPATYGAPESLKAIHPLGKSPLLTDGELTIAESGAIIEYIIDGYDSEKQFRPAAGQPLLDYRYWLHAAEGSLMPLLVMRLVLNKALDKPMPFFARPIIKKFVAGLNQYFIDPRLLPQLELIDAHLAQHCWFAGEEISGADMQMMLSLQLAKQRCDLTPYTHIARYMQQVESRTAYQRAMSKLV